MRPLGNSRDCATQMAEERHRLPDRCDFPSNGLYHGGTDDAEALRKTVCTRDLSLPPDWTRTLTSIALLLLTERSCSSSPRRE